jgi:carboxylesterase type B
MTGVMRDDGNPFTSYSKNQNASAALQQEGYNASAILGSGLFPLPQNSQNMTLNIFNLTSRVATDALFRCPTQSTAFSAAKNGALKKVYAYEMERSYQLTRYSPNSGVCDAPKTESHPYGDTTLPYYRCHSGDLYLVFGNYQREGRRIRDVDDVPFTQYIMDTWLAFGRTGDPNPAQDFLEARGFLNTSLTVKGIRPWRPIKMEDVKLRVLDLKPVDKGFNELKQCDVLGQPLNYYAT